MASASLVFFITVGFAWGLPAPIIRRDGEPYVPSQISFIEAVDKNYNRKEIYERVKSWTPEDKGNVWELSGLLEGDIMTNPQKNGLLDKAMRWPSGIVPFYIKEEDFGEEDIAEIEAAIAEYHEKTCIRFRAYNKSDKAYVVIQGSAPGCWSSVGRQGKGQVINLQNPGCLKRGTIIHEILHALGFYHQQSSFDRDDYVQIVWDNISKGKEHNFDKYNNKLVTDFGVGYDYGSVMHYSGKAFTSNGNPTIVPLKEGVTIGQRKGFSKKDITKLQAMYKDECKSRDNSEKSSEFVEDALTWIFP
ncbi:zinc metalloproteinase nas-13 [Fopius arisanus]|uniref:Metalloendopeptidase n=1 Tax=Fopius arisanus TaxID=64838 RepID=A0A0C9R9Q2_9HYME|nr:PREDICTED: zinc metalloproteinase nas-13-like [Fopius arisanus]